MLGGLATGALAGAIGRVGLSWIPVEQRAWLVAAVLWTCLIVDGLPRLFPLPTVIRQVNETWIPRFRGVVYGLGFGVQLGTGLTTIVTTATVYGCLLVAALTASVTTGAAIGAAFGTFRALPMLAGARLTTPARIGTLSMWFLRREMRMKAFFIGALAILTIALTASVASSS